MQSMLRQQRPVFRFASVSVDQDVHVDDDMHLEIVVYEALVQSGGHPLPRFGVECNGDTVRLHGTVRTFHQKQLAQESIRHVEGVRNDLRVEAPVQSTNVGSAE